MTNICGEKTEPIHLDNASEQSAHLRAMSKTLYQHTQRDFR
jgi:hypothetical protein